MKISNLLYLAKKSLKADKKSTNVIILLMAISMVVIIPIVVMWVAVNYSVSNAINSKPYMLYRETEMSDYRVDDGGTEKLSGYDNISKFDNIDNKIVYERYNLTSEFLLSETYVNVGDIEVKLDKKDRYFAIADIDKSEYCFPKNLDSFDGGAFVEGCGKGFIDGKGEVVVTEEICSLIGVKANDVYGKNITIRMTQTVGIDHYDGYLAYHYKVVGVIRSAISELFSNSSSYLDSLLFFTSDSVYSNGKWMLKPNLVLGNDGFPTLEYENIGNKEDLNKEYMMLGIGAMRHSDSILATTKIFVEGQNYAMLSSSTERIERNGILFDSSEIYENYKKIYDISTILTFVFMIVGIVLLSITILYYYIDIKYNVNKKKHFLTMLRALGAHDQDIPRLYLLEANIVTGIASLIFAIIGFAVCAAVKLSIDSIMKIGDFAIAVSVGWGSIIAVIAVMIAIMFMISNIISLICVKGSSRGEIVTVLKSN